MRRPVLRIDRRAPIVTSAPLRGSGWLNANGCCRDSTSPHRETRLSSSNGAYVTPEIVAVDWIRVGNGAPYTGDGKQNSDWPDFGAPGLRGGEWHRGLDRQQQAGHPTLRENPDHRTVADYPGNNVILKLGPGRYAAWGYRPRSPPPPTAQARRRSPQPRHVAPTRSPSAPRTRSNPFQADRASRGYSMSDASVISSPTPLLPPSMRDSSLHDCCFARSRRLSHRPPRQRLGRSSKATLDVR
jgi:hypothetical protein